VQCRLCGANNTMEKIVKEVRYFYCQECEFIFKAREDIITAVEEKERYEQHNNTPDNEGYVKMFTRFIDTLISPRQKEIATALDFGCGPGPVLASLLRKKGFEVDIYDPYFFPQKSFEEKKYDLITSTEVFEHLYQPCREIELIKDHLKSGGYLAVMTSFHPGFKNIDDWWYKTDPTHIAFYNKRTFAWIASNFSFEIIYEDGEKYCLLRGK